MTRSTGQTMSLAVALNRASKARTMLTYFDEQEAAGFPVWDAESVASGREQFRRSMAGAVAFMVVEYGYSDETIRSMIDAYRRAS